MKRCVALFAILVLLCTTSGCGTQQTETDDTTKARIAKLEQQLADAQAKIAHLQSATPPPVATVKPTASMPTSVLYMSYEHKRRFLARATDVLWMPAAGSQRACTSLPNTVAEVLFAGDVNGETWLYVVFPVYDTPMDNRGWVREADTLPYDSKTQKQVQGDVFAKEGVTVYDDASGSGKRMLVADTRGYIMARKDGKAQVSAAGGDIFWVDEGNINYPDIQ